MSESLRSVLLQEIRARFPSIDWNLGSVVRELVVEPLAKLSDLLDSRVNAAKSSLDVTHICANPDTYKQEIDSWMSRLGLTPQSAVSNTGTVRIMRTSSSDLTIAEGTQFSWADEVLLYTENTYIIKKEKSSGDGADVLVYKSYGDAAFSVDIPVTSVAAYSSGSLGAGAPLNWAGAPSDVYDICVGSAITGGSGEVGYQEKARQILDSMVPDSLSGEACIKKALRRNFPDLVKDVVVGDKDINKPYAVSLYIKPVRSIQEFIIPFYAEYGNGELSSCGVYEISEVFGPDGSAVPFTATYPKDSGESGSVIKINTSSTETSDKFSARVIGFAEYQSINKWLAAEAKSTPFEFNLKLPAVGIVKLYLAATGTEYTGAKTSIAELISDSSINSPISDSSIERVLNDYDSGLAKSVVYSVELYQQNNRSTHTLFRAVSADVLRYTVTAPLALYSQTNLVEITRA